MMMVCVCVPMTRVQTHTVRHMDALYDDMVYMKQVCQEGSTII